MHKNYIILAHTNPEQLKRLVSRLSDGCSSFYIHIDKKSEINAFLACFENAAHVTFIPDRVDCIWGDFSQVEATLNLINEVISGGREGYTIFLSGQDYPIKSNREINAFLEKNSGFEFISLEHKPIQKAHYLYKERVEAYKINISSKRWDYVIVPYIFSPIDVKRTFAKFLLRKVSVQDLLLSFKKRKQPFAEHCKGPQWWAFSSNTLHKIHSYVQDNKEELFSYYKHTIYSDEQFFHTILWELMKRDPDIRLKDYLHYINWEREGVELPVTFDRNDIEELVSQPEDKLFARKFDARYDAEILDKLDKHLQQQCIAAKDRNGKEP
ncbi:beta-1,6-N-acetylglucosaminyltransferase [Pontibacter akesuensis]|uniref:Peptide O-xylosyltransferase n=1 Tax=Pontibacter akesuensis TaxID=388950 RepID=A0A1I7HV82_9BACT|nr:beta-1,6-N-acetylglucosaminyltransferase [Pontibacter akesuensis]GHA63687.1 glycosyl transferase [Pontibacter akesuensis]SFU64551.1 Core-2/I-Branching enzyme [Pontibacter akesuensis]